ncbi:uncharacterized protein OCT59_000571 [Rhizophagus irregularis]|uniref:uncharacterized protein n=1 Tax=Rhizophagus irregularis TaxID=588596 RepID=UPI001A031BA5|nr:hypothetical protein OCT59_000571 [Rhizophagus irregularis]GBC48102.2 hypothetical protein GLOIN_2v1719991 [Rhizophagus irregularis DAOM 181602=DAOM 197198]
MYTFVNFFSQSFYQTNSTLTPPPSPTTASTLQHECNICKTSFKSQSGLTRHNTIVQKYNTRREGLYELPLEAIKEFKAQLVHIIQGYIHYYSVRTGSYKCYFQGPDAYTQIANLFDNPNWGRKFFDNNQQTFVVLFDALAESDANQESLFNQVGNWIPKNRLKRFNLPKLTVEWKYKKSREDAKKNRTSAGYISLRFCAQQI